MKDVEVVEQGAIPTLSPQETLFNLGIDEAALDDLIASAGVEVDADDLPVARVITADILLASIFAADLPQGIDFGAVLNLLTVTNEPRFADAMPELATKVLALANEEKQASGADAYFGRMRLVRDRIFGVKDF